MASSYLKALDLALEVPTVAREQPVNVCQLRLLAEIAEVPAGLDRVELLGRETHDKPTVDARIKYLCGKELIEARSKNHYHDLQKYQVTGQGNVLNAALRGRRSSRAYKAWLDEWIELLIVKREAPINVDLLKVHTLVEQSPNITTTELLEYVSGAKQTLKGRLKWLQRKGLIEKYPKFKAGGNGNPDFYVAL